MRTETRKGLVVTLWDSAGSDVALVGTKARNLGRLAAAGFSVPEGVVLTTEACVRAPASGGLSAEARLALAGIAEHFGDALLAVRSSSTAEDLAGASYAGQYETMLGVRGAEALEQAVLRCRRSASGPRARHYAGEFAPMAVLVQRQCSPDAAGIAFTADPITGDRDRVLVSATSGLGDVVAGGEITPDEWVVTGSVASAVHATGGALTAQQAMAIATTARRVESVMGEPQDIEWAMDDGRLVLLQSRPITALPVPPEVDVPEGTWMKETERYAGPMTALGASGAVELVSAGLTGMFAEYGGLIERVECLSIGGEIYQRLTPVGARGADAPPPWFVLAVLSRTVPVLRRRMRQAARKANPKALAEVTRSWRSQWRPNLENDLERARQVTLADLDRRQLAAHLDDRVEGIRTSMMLHFRMMPPYLVPLHHFVLQCRSLLGWDTSAALELLAGTSRTSSEPARAMAELAGRVRQTPGLVDAVRAAADPAEALRAASAELADDFGRWCDRYAYRCVSDDPGSAALIEQPWLLGRLLVETGMSNETGPDAARRDAIERARRQLRARGAVRRRRFEAALAAASTSYGLREEVAFWTASVPAGLVRLTAMEAGRRFVGDGRLDRAEDVVDLDLGTLRRALRDPALELRETVRRSRAERAWVRHHPGPAYHGSTPPRPPDVRGLPRAARRLNAAAAWSRFDEFQTTESASVGSLLNGAAGSSGRHTGTVRILHDPGDFGRLAAGDVLVTVMTDPAWSVLFGVAGALVTDTGGLLSHAAIVAREHGIPAVVGTGSATTTLHDGDVVTVDGSTGNVFAPEPAGRSAKRSRDLAKEEQ